MKDPDPDLECRQVRSGSEINNFGSATLDVRLGRDDIPGFWK